MQTRSSSRLASNPSSNLTPSTNPNSKGRNRRCSKQRIEDFNLEELSPPIVRMADQRTMAQLLQAPTEGYEDAIIVPAITADNFELKHGLLTLVQNKQFFVHDKEDPHAHVRYFNKITSTLKFLNVTNTSIKLMLFPFSLEGATRIWLEKEPPPSIFTWDDLLRGCPHHGFSELHQLDTFYNALNSKDQDSLNSAAGDMVKALLLDKKSQSPATVKAVEESCVTCDGAHSYRNCPTTDGNVYRDNIQEFVSQASAVNYNQGNTSYRPPMMSNQIQPPGFPLVPNNQNVQRNNQNRFIPNQNRGNNFNQGPVYQPLVFQPPAYHALACQAPAPQTQGVLKEDFPAYVKANDAVVEDEPETKKDTMNPTNNESTKDIQPLVVQSEPPILTSKPVTSPISKPAIDPVSALKPNPKTSIPYPSRRNDKRNREKANNQIKKFYQIFKDMSFEISFADALILMPKFTSTLKALIGNNEKLSEMARTPLNEHCSTVLLKKLPEKLGDPGKFLIPCDFSSMAECLALADIGASINLMPFLVWKRLSLPNLTPTYMTLELANCSISHFDADPRVPLILERSFLKTRRALIDVFEGELTLRVGKEAITFNLDQTSIYSANYSDMMAKRIDMACEEYSQKVLGFSDTISSGNPTPYYDPIVSMTSPTLTLFGNSDFLLEEGDILLLEAFLNDDPSPPPSQGNYLPEVRKELKIYEAKYDKSSVDEPPTVELKDLPPYLEYAFLEGDDKLSVIIAKDLSVEEKTSLITVLKSHKRAIAWKLYDIKGIDPEFCTHKILMEEDFEPAVQHQRRVNPKIHDVIKQEVIKLLEAGLIYPISDSPWVSPVHCVPKKGGFTVVKNKENELIPTRLVTGENHITCPYRTFAYRRMPFGLSNAPGTFQRCMMAIIHDIINKTMEVFMDDLYETSHFIVKEGIVLGHKISKQGIEVDKAKVDVITKLPHPTTVNGIRSFFGHAGFYRRFIKDFSKIARPMTRLLEKDTPFIFSQECVVAFQTLKRKLMEAPILIAPDWDMPFELMCDANDYTIGAVLGQHQDKHFRPIHYASRTMTAAESNYTITEKEMLAVVYAFEKFWSYLIMNKSIVYTDHSARKYLFAKKDSKARLLRWVLLL
uniref:Reverse transcriptase domain-containing protein n=1 Tax=Tanacetum cinerariifolium TaxID=118510 RepID=A0A6L2LE38_TANCI|nr:reverse transcriptase domain-containing protein [Tanacetum cinerariifolium]